MFCLSSNNTFDDSNSTEEERDDNYQIMPISSQSCTRSCKSYSSRSDYFLDQLKEKQFNINSVYHMNSLFEDGLVLIKGDIMIPFQKSTDFSRLSKYNQYKKITRVEYDTEIATLEMSFEQMKYGIDQFDHIIKILQQQPDQDHRKFGIELQMHKERMDNLKRIRESLKMYKQIDQIRLLVESSFASFYEKVRQNIKIMVKEGQLTFFKYNIFKVDYEKGDYLMTHCSTNQVLLALLGLDVSQAQSFLMRKGIFEVMQHYDFFGVSNYFLQIKNKNLTSDRQTDIVLKTFDGIDVYANIKWIILTNDDPLIQNMFNTDFQHFAIIQAYEIKQNMIDFVLAYRRTANSKFDVRALENEQDWDYSAKAQSFIDKFY